MSTAQQPRSRRLGGKPGKQRQPRSLRTRLVLGSVALIAVVCAVIGTVTTIALHSYLYEQLDKQVSEVAEISDRPLNRPGEQGAAPDQQTDDPLKFLGGPGRAHTVAALLSSDGTVTEAAKSVSDPESATKIAYLNAAQKAALQSVPQDGKAHSVYIPGLGDYRVALSERGSTLVGLPEADVQDTISTLIAVEVSVTAAGLVAASIAGVAMVGVALRPLRRVAATATRVSELPLHSGEVALYERVPEAEADPRTEIGQVGAALNRMLDHIHAALDARQRSETRVRQFVADASHELRTPLASIRGYAELTRWGREETGPDTRHALGRIESEANRMSGLVEDLLLLARLDAGRPLSYESTDLSPLVVDAVSDARAAGQDHKWRLELPDEPALVLADAARLQQVLVNLLANARTHTPPGTTVTARVRRQASRVCLDIEDDGPGIPPELLPHVFERFARGDSSRSRHSGSTGLGLAIVHAVASAHGGTVTVDSVPGRTVFTVHLPAYQESVPLPAYQQSVPLPAYQQSVPLPADDASVPHSQTGHSLTTQA
ncbi:HAMP domain-containing histidine kinase [Streptomyces sp. PSKA54]|uniref:histidine kinase n=1 Tax=Streptomyces himalayensis subsp. aureolus TaxID=2758039 RepID=A0A7W2D9L4_9ACTN|nr:HAMP domain-containing sensor histidine kinase [Streptomyces himalayensis]MBA4867157.1 HAMP domain-containing histidine kinase [Streptomyces himalayensis subsp. aureolus]